MRERKRENERSWRETLERIEMGKERIECKSESESESSIEKEKYKRRRESIEKM